MIGSVWFSGPWYFDNAVKWDPYCYCSWYEERGTKVCKSVYSQTNIL